MHNLKSSKVMDKVDSKLHDLNATWVDFFTYTLSYSKADAYLFVSSLFDSLRRFSSRLYDDGESVESSVFVCALEVRRSYPNVTRTIFDKYV